MPNLRTKNGYSTKAKAPCGYRDVKLSAAFQLRELGSVIVEVQLLLVANADMKGKVSEQSATWQGLINPRFCF